MENCDDLCIGILNTHHSENSMKVHKSSMGVCRNVGTRTAMYVDTTKYEHQWQTSDQNACRQVPGIATAISDAHRS